MGQQVIKQPDGLYAIFSSITDTWIVYDATRKEISNYFARQAADDARHQVDRIFARLDTNPAAAAYYQFTLTFEEANAMSVEHDGEDLSGKLVT
jgi:hypothetical protein